MFKSIITKDVSSKISESGKKVIVVPVSFAAFQFLFNLACRNASFFSKRILYTLFSFVFQLLAKYSRSVNNRYAYSMQAAGNFIAFTAEILPPAWRTVNTTSKADLPCSGINWQVSRVHYLSTVTLLS